MYRLVVKGREERLGYSFARGPGAGLLNFNRAHLTPPDLRTVANPSVRVTKHGSLADGALLP